MAKETAIGAAAAGAEMATGMHTEQYIHICNNT